MFAGTGIVGFHFKSKGFKVISNDLQYYSYVFNKHYQENNFFDKNRNFNIDIGLINYLNKLEITDEKAGFIYNNYCKGSGSNRMYFTDKNGLKIDIIRTKIEQMYKNNEISENDYFFAIGSLLKSADKRANTTAVYGAFLKHIKGASAKDIVLEPLDFVDGRIGEVYNENANDLILKIKGDVLYLDPPYNERQYCGDYHLLETIAKYDNPQIHGVSGRRSNENKRSMYCKKRESILVFEDLIKNANFKHIFVSYNNEGIINFEDMKNILSKYGKYKLFSTPYKRFKSNNLSKDIKEVKEYLHYIEKYQI